MAPRLKVRESLELLTSKGVDFVVIGGAAMGLQGSAYVTKDLDLAYSPTNKNIYRLAQALSEIHPRPRVPDGTSAWHPCCDVKSIKDLQNLALTTDFGDLDLFGQVAGFHDFPHLISMSDAIQLFGKSYKVLSAKGLVVAKRAAGRPRDLVVIPELEALEELQKSHNPTT